MKHRFLNKKLKFLILIYFSIASIYAQESGLSSFKIRQEVKFRDISCKDANPLLQIINEKSGWKQFCGEKKEFYEDKRVIDGVIETVKIHCPTNLIIRGDYREDDFTLVDVSTFFYDLNNDGKKEVFFDHHSPYATAPFNILAKDMNDYRVLDEDGLIRNAEIYILENQTNGYSDILLKSDYWHELWLYQYDGKLYKLIKRIKSN